MPAIGAAHGDFCARGRPKGVLPLHSLGQEVPRSGQTRLCLCARLLLGRTGLNCESTVSFDVLVPCVAYELCVGTVRYNHVVRVLRFVKRHAIGRERFTFCLGVPSRAALVYFFFKKILLLLLLFFLIRLRGKKKERETKVSRVVVNACMLGRSTRLTALWRCCCWVARP